MTTTTLIGNPAPALPVAVARTHGPLRKASDVAVLFARNLVHISREPFQLSDVTIQPVLFTLMFVYVFGAGVVLPGGASYTDFAIPGLLVLNQVTATVGTAVGLSRTSTPGSSTGSGPCRCGARPCWWPARSPTC